MDERVLESDPSLAGAADRSTGITGAVGDAEAAALGQCAPPTLHGTDDLFAWRGGGIVLLVERADGPEGERWVVARGWPSGDRLTDVRRWTFASPTRLAGQVRRLAGEATGDTAAAVDLAARALAWATRP